jgi:succinyl-CoA synthetase alpha subunit
MSILSQPDTKILIQESPAASVPGTPRLSLDYGSQVVAGVTPGKGGQTFDHDGAKSPSSTPSPKP